MSELDAPAARTSARQDAASIAALVACTAVIFRAALGSSNVFFVRDVLQMHLPLMAFKARAWAAGEFPFWNPQVFGGTPFAADLVAQAFYLPTLLGFVGPLAFGFNLFSVFHLLWAAVGVYVLCRARGSGWAGALIGGMSFGFGGVMVSCITAQQFLCAYAWAPWVLAAAARWADTRKARWVGALALALAMQFFAGDPQAVIVTVLLVVLLHARRDVRLFAGFACAGLLSALTTSVLWSSTLEMISDTDRRSMTDLGSAEWWSLNPARLLELFQPLPFGGHYPDLTFWGGPLLNGPFAGPYYFSLYGSAAVAGLAVVGALRCERRERIVLLVALGVVLLLSFGRWGGLYRVFFYAMPGWSLFRYPERVTVFVMLLLAVLAARGVDSLALRRPGTFGVLLGLAAVPLLFAAGVSAVNPEVLGTVLVSSLSGAGVLALAALAARAHTARQALVPLALVALVAADLAVADSRLVWLASSSEVIEHRPRLLAEPVRGRLFRDGALDSWLRPDPRNPTPFFLAKARFELATLAPNAGLIQSVRYWLAFSSLRPAAFERLWSSVDHDRLYDAFGVTDIVASTKEQATSLSPAKGYRATATIGPVTRFENLDALPRAWFVSAAVGCGSRDGAFEKMVSQDLRTAVLLESSPGGGEPSQPLAATLVSESLNRVQWQVDAPTAGWLVTSDAHAPGWSAHVDGAEAPVLRANVIMRAVHVEAGAHTVEMTFRPTWLGWGATGSTLGVLLSLALVFVRRGRLESLPAHRPPSQNAASSTTSPVTPT
ncbi:MAG: YfhO family protein [Myxococcaceae bacterium]|nr:YfhO family protein [Myxococcaceae bacterium]